MIPSGLYLCYGYSRFQQTSGIHASHFAPNVNSSDQLAPGGAIYDADNQPTLTQRTRLTSLSQAYQLATPKLNRSNDDRLLNFTNYWNHFHTVCNIYGIVTQISEDVVIYCTLQQKSAQENQVKYVALCRYCTAVPLFSCEIKFKKILKNNQGVRNCRTLLDLSKIKVVYCCKLASEINLCCSLCL